MTFREALKRGSYTYSYINPRYITFRKATEIFLKNPEKLL